MRTRPWIIGVFIIFGFGLLNAILFLIGNRQKAFSKHLELYSEFSDLGGLAKGAKVRVSGLDAGELKQIDIPKTPSARFRLELQIEEKVRGMVRKDSVVSIETEGVVGDKFISIKKGTNQAEEAQAGSTLPSKEPLDLTALLEKGSMLLSDVHGGVNEVREHVDVALDSITRTVNHGDQLLVESRPNIDKMLTDGKQITGRVSTLLSDLNDGKGPAGMLLKDEVTKQQLRATLTNVERASADLSQASARVDQTVTDFQSRDLLAKAQVTIENVQAISQELQAAVQEALTQDSMGQDGASNLRETLSNLNRSTSNFAENTEALKHNFFFRSFFKKRGFYNLDQVTPAEYLDACERQKKAGSRKWLQASSLVVSDTHGEEQLSAAGRHQIDGEVATVVDSLPDLVRRYLETRYHLRHSDIGIVPLRNKPPQSAGRDNWDGAAIMLLKVKSNK